MLRNYLTTHPYTKFVLIEDTIQERGKPIFDFLLKTHLEKPQNTVHYFVFQDIIGRIKQKLKHNNIILHDFVTNIFCWNKDPKTGNFEETTKNLGGNSVIFIDSLAHVIYKFGLAETYRILNNLKKDAAVQQIVVLLHQDLLEEHLRVEQLLEHLCTLSISLFPNVKSENGRLQYTYKKVGGKIIKGIEEYWIDNQNLVTKKIEKLDTKKLLEKSVSAEINPETLSTFKIGLTEEDKRIRDERRGEILPYLPKPENQNDQDSGRIFYQFDEVDDWDEEDPDDDLDI